VCRGEPALDQALPLTGPAVTRKALMPEHSHHGMEVLAVEIEQIKGRYSGQGYRYNPEHGSSFATAG